jgi:methyltransferase (TIGR00027 family)
MGPAEKLKIRLSGIQETLLITLWARAHDADQPKPILGDTWARYVLNQIEGGEDDKPDRGLLTPFVALRTRSLDSWTTAFLDKHAQTGATVISLACGLDSRCLRLKWGPNIRWIDVELPDVATLREKLLPKPGGDYKLIAASATEDTWLKDVPADRPTFIIFEGLSMYLAKDEGENLLERLSAHFPSGEIAFDAVRPVMITCQAMFRKVATTGSTLKWAVDDPKGIEARHPRLRLRDVRIHSCMDGLAESPISARIVLSLLDYVPGVWGTGYHLRYEF